MSLADRPRLASRDAAAPLAGPRAPMAPHCAERFLAGLFNFRVGEGVLTLSGNSLMVRLGAGWVEK